MQRGHVHLAPVHTVLVHTVLVHTVLVHTVLVHTVLVHTVLVHTAPAYTAPAYTAAARTTHLSNLVILTAQRREALASNRRSAQLTRFRICISWHDLSRQEMQILKQATGAGRRRRCAVRTTRRGFDVPLIDQTMPPFLMRLALLLVVILAALAPARAQQVAIPRIDAMPAMPADYRLRDWDGVARGLDSLVFDLTRTGTYFPLAAAYGGTVNYPAHGSFGIETYVGQGNEIPGETITALPALVGATWAGANKRTQFGTDWVLRAEQFFNRRPAENVYLNAPQTTSGSDWWYDTMPNVFFYQLRAQYPGTGQFDGQFRSVADQWSRAVAALGGSAAPWRLPAITYRAFALSTMTPRAGGVPEPEAAGAIAWLLYSAYRETGEARYRIAAEQAIEALAAQAQNPAYELQLPYGTLAAARMNAELGTHLDVAKMLRWSFDRGPLRGWGTIQGITRGGRSLDGLVGEVDGNGYAFALNGFQQAAALVPVARYDDRFARAIGRWMVNLASASRNFYSTELPAANQDGTAWAVPNDPRGLVAYEALRGSRNGQSPFATGDGVGFGQPTNLALYASMSVGYLAAVVDSTEVPGILRLDLRKTDVYRTPSYPSFLVYNPYPTAQTVTVPLTFGTYDVYDAAANAFLARGVSGRPAVTIPPDAARVLVFPPAGGTETSVDGRRAVNGIVIDYDDGTGGNRPPRVRALVATDTTLARAQPTTLYCTPDDAETATPTVEWSASRGDLVPNGRTATWSSSDTGDADITCTASDGSRTGADTIRLRVVQNQAPVNVQVGAAPPTTDVNGTTTLTCAATDPDDDPLTYAWSASAGSVPAQGASVTFAAPGLAQVVTVTCTASDPSGATASATARVVVGRLVLDLPLNGNAVDATPFANSGTVSGPASAPGRDGQPGHALSFNGTSDAVAVPSSVSLASTAAVSVSVWIAPSALPDRELFVVSHGSYENRWKLSLTPGAVPRWTVNTTARIADLDAPAPVAVNTFTHLVATYDGARLVLYVNGARVSETPLTGAIRTTELPLLLGQRLPNDANYNFPGLIDDVRVYNVALTPAEVLALFSGTVSGEDGPGGGAGLGQPFPNPARGRVTVPLSLAREARVSVTVVDALGRTVAVLHDGLLPAGASVLAWDAPAGLAAGVYVVRLAGDAGEASRRVLVVR